MTINGLPLHPLVVHATVVCLPLTALLGIAYAVPRWRDRVRWALLVLAALSALLVWLTAASGDSLARAIGESPAIRHHEDLAGKLETVTYVFAGVAAVAVWLHGRRGWLRQALGALVAIGAVAVIVLTVLTGDAGARAAWAGVS